MAELHFYSAHDAPFSLHGVYFDGECYRRVPQSIGDATSEAVAQLCRHTSGGRVRFSTNATRLAVRARLRADKTYMNITQFCQTGFDLYRDDAKRSAFQGVFCANFENRFDFTAELALEAGEKELTLYFPTYGEVTQLEIGVEAGTSVSSHAPYKNGPPIVFYGSSITQGASASRPGLSYPAIISRRSNTDFINLGFSGACKGEAAMVEYIATLPMAAFVCDFDHNCSSAEKLKLRHFPVYERIREKHPTIPFYMVTRPDFYYNKMDFDRRAVVMESYLRARALGDENVYFIDGSAFFNGADSPLEMTIDGTHPTDEGMARMASYIGGVLRETMTLK